MHVSECGFEPYERDDGLHPTGRPRPAYDNYLRQHGYDAPNPWEHWANSGAAEDGSLQNGWLLVHADKAARVPDEHSETPYMTRRAMEFIAEAEDRRTAVVPASVLHQAALALHRAGALRQHVRPQTTSSR